MRRSILSAILVLSSSSIQAGKFWEELPFQEWNREQIIQILSKSPWARQVHIRPEKIRALSRGSGEVPSASGIGGGLMTRSGPVHAGDHVGGGGLDNTGGAFGSFHPLFVRWDTSLPVRQAMARLRYQGAALASPEAQKLLEPERDHFVICIAGLPPQMARLATEEKDRILEEIRVESFLKIKGRPPLAAEIVQLRTEQGWAELRILFPRRGSQDIRLKDKRVEFVSKISKQKISRKFKLKDMVFKGVLEL